MKNYNKLLESINNIKEIITPTSSDERACRTLIADEYDAIQTYEELATKSEDERVRKVFLDIAKEEKVHVKELEALLRVLGMSDDALKDQGDKEVKDLINESKETDEVYHERDQLVALISKIFPSHIGKDEEQKEGFKNVIYVQLPTGQCSWHIKDSELSLFKHLEHGKNNWDGHSTKEKYNRIAKYEKL